MCSLGNMANTFSLDAATGVVTVAIPPTFDMTPEFSLTISVTDRGTNPSSLASSVVFVSFYDQIYPRLIYPKNSIFIGFLLNFH